MADAKTKVEPVGYVNDSFRDALLEHKGSVYWHGQMVCGKPFDGSHPIYLAAPQPAASDVPHDVVAAEATVRRFAEKQLAQNIQWALDPRYLITLCDALATPVPSTSTETKCFECDGPLHGPYCPACRPTEEALRAENALEPSLDAWGYAYAVWRQGQRSTPRCEGPGEAEVRICRDLIEGMLACRDTAHEIDRRKAARTALSALSR